MEHGSSNNLALPRIPSASSPLKSSRSRTNSIKGSKKKRNHRSSEGASNLQHNSSPIPVAKKQKQFQPLKGFLLSISTLKESLSVGKKSGKDNNMDVTGYNEVCKISKDMGAEVVGQVSKRVQLLLCTRGAAHGATQRVRKAYKKRIPIVDVAWLAACREAGGPVDMDPFLLDEEAKDGITKRESNEVMARNPACADASLDPGWTEPVSYGCSCVCHENGSEKDCKWCSNGCAAL